MPYVTFRFRIFFVSFSTLLVPLEVETSDFFLTKVELKPLDVSLFFLYSKEVGSHWSHGAGG